MCYNNKPDLSHSHCFGCVAYVLNDSPEWQKLDPKGKRTLFVGYSEMQKGWHVYHLDKRKIKVSAHVKFDDNADLRDSFQAEGKYQFSYKSLKSSDYDDDASQKPAPPPEPPAPVNPIEQPPPPQ